MTISLPTSLNDLLSRYRTSIMGVAMFWVILFHQGFITNNAFFDFFHLFGASAVDVFLLVSGFGVANSLQKNTLQRYYANRAWRLLPVCILVGCTKLLLQHYGWQVSQRCHPLLLATGFNLWFIYAIVIYYTIAPWLYRMILRHGWVTVAIVCAFSLLGNTIPFSRTPYVLVSMLGMAIDRLAPFVMGIYIVVRSERHRLFNIFIVGCVFLAIYIHCRLASVYLLNNHHLPGMHLAVAFATPMLCMVFATLSRLFEFVRLNCVLEFFGRYSLELFLLHAFVFNNLRAMGLPTSVSPYVSLLLGFVLTSILAFLTHWLCSLAAKNIRQSSPHRTN